MLLFIYETALHGLVGYFLADFLLDSFQEEALHARAAGEGGSVSTNGG